MKNSTKLKGFLAIFISAVMFGTYPTFMRILDGMYGEYSQILVRVLVAIIPLTIYILIKKSSIRVDRKDIPNLILFIVTIPITSFLIIFSVLMVKASTAVFMLYAGSLLVAFLIGTLIFKENVNSTKIVSLVAVVIGLLIFTFPIDSSSILGIVLGFLSGAVEGISNAIRKKLGDIPRNTTLFYQFLFTIFASLVAIIITNETMIKEVTTSGIVVTVVFGLSLILLGNLMLYGFKHFDANIGTTVLSSEMLFSVIFALIFLYEIPTEQELLGGILIFLGANIPHIYEFTKPYLHKLKYKV